MRITLPLLLLTIVVSVPFVATPVTTQTRVAGVPTPHDVLGFTPGDDRKLASWNQVLTYFQKLDAASNRVEFEALGKTTMDVPFVMATISAPENLARLDEYKRIQTLLADPRRLGPPAVRDRKARELIRRGKTIVLITCGIHSTEVGSYLSSMLIAHKLASSNEPVIQEILRNTIVLLVPSLNPDGVDIVKNWYDKTLGTPYEGTDPPELYHKYVGHDNNRDWYAFTQVETKITVDKIHNVWHPHIVHDIHQQGAFGSRLFLPPYMQPVEPNVPKQIVDGYTELGNWIAAEMRRAGFEGITTGSTYDAWTPARAYSHYHAGVRILSETASARIASPITVKFDQLRPREGYDPQKASAKFGPVWKGGEWRLRNITNYMTTAAFTLLKHSSQNREQWLTRFYSVGKEAVRPRKQGELFGFIVPFQFGNYNLLLNTLRTAGVEVDLAQQFTFQGKTYQSGAAIIRTAQPYGSFATAVMREQLYPNLRDEKGHPIAPYDVTAHTLPLLYGVPVVPIYQAPRYQKLYQSEGAIWPNLSLRPIVSRVGLYKSHVPSMDEGWTRWLFEQSIRHHTKDPAQAASRITALSLSDKQIRQGKLATTYDAIVFPDQAPRTILGGYSQAAMPTEYTGGLGSEGVKSLHEFVEAGGTLVFFNRASDFAIEHFKLPVRNIVAHLPEKDFYVPGSILRIELDTSHPISDGMPRQSIAWVEDSPVFEIKGGDGGKTARVIARYPTTGNPLLSGWLLGAERLKGQPALIEFPVGKGRIILFGFRPQYRAQSLATYPLIFNALRR